MKKILILCLFLLNLYSNENNNYKKITAMDYLIENNLYMEYANFIKNKDGYALLDKLLNSKDRVLTTKESLLKGFYSYYYLNNSKDALAMLDKVYDKNLNFIQNNINGLFLQNIYIRENEFEKAKNIIDFYYCYSIEDEILKKSCLYNNFFLNNIVNENFDSNFIFNKYYKENKDLFFNIFKNKN